MQLVLEEELLILSGHLHFHLANAIRNVKINLAQLVSTSHMIQMTMHVLHTLLLVLVPILQEL